MIYCNNVNVLINFFFIYLFVFIGFIAKKQFKDRVNEQSFVLVYIYFLMPIVMIWGILSKPLDVHLFLIPSYFLIILIMSFVCTFLISKTFLKDKKNQAIGTITGVIGNTGNIGIPLGLALYGIDSVPYTAMINLINALCLMTIGAYTDSRGTFSFITSVINILKLPMIWATIIAFIIQILKITFYEEIYHFLEMGAYTGLVLQLIIFGMFLSSVKWNVVYPRISVIVLGSKFLLVPGLTLGLIHMLNLPPFFKGILFLQAIVPIAVNNVNLAALYDCYAEKVAWISFIAFILAIILLPFGLIIVI